MNIFRIGDKVYTLGDIEAMDERIAKLQAREVAREAFIKGAEWWAQCELDDTLHLDENQAAFEYANTRYPIGKE